jgi:hypothetical protein
MNYPHTAPQKCAQCGAMIDPLALACPYCRFTTARGVAAHQQHQHHQQWAAHASYAHSAAAHARMKSTATQALVFGILGIVLFCTPLGIVGIIQGFRARGMSREANGPVPGIATAGLILSIVSLVTSIAGIVLIDQGVQEDKALAEQRATAAEKRIGNKPTLTTLDRDTACGIAEIHAYREGIGGLDGHQVRDFQCIGKLTFDETARTERGEIDLVRVKDVTKAFDHHACLKRGGKWYVERFTTGPCF